MQVNENYPWVQMDLALAQVSALSWGLTAHFPDHQQHWIDPLQKQLIRHVIDQDY
jgi:hypothetical protein